MGNKLIISLTVAVAIAMASITAFAATAAETRTAEIAATLTNRSIDSVLRESYSQHKTFAQIADEAGKLDDFKKQVSFVQDNTLKQHSSSRINKKQEKGMLEKLAADYKESAQTNFAIYSSANENK
ncbi:hypothetical protein [Pectinatus sottacetonis]|uniref:hypothetical protein n=1 Tax=Pectinatus sottacetonis TaxID=1002795 RepID=UPI0018C50CBA|nr:hypothetical protein [Pectinatus sottacetonis]